MTIHDDDQLLLQKYRDGELDESATQRLEQRLLREPALRASLDDYDERSRGFAFGREQAFAPSAGFTAAVLAEVRQLPSRIELEQQEVAGRALVICRRVLIAAAILFGIGLCWHAGLFPDGRNDTLEADPAEVEREMERLDEIARQLGRQQGR